VSLGKRLMLKGLRRALKMPPETSDGRIFESRVDGFLVTPESGTKVRVIADGFVYQIRQRSKRSGLFQGRIDVPLSMLPLDETSQVEVATSETSTSPDSQQAKSWQILSRNGVLDLHTDTEFGSSLGKVYFADRTGLSVITDIDDTIKITDVTSRSRMLSRTFLEPFEPIEGMAALYQKLHQDGAMFHYVSSSPWQIYLPLQQFLDDHGFPGGSMHLKWFRLRDEFFKRWSIIRKKSKAGTIETMIKRMPQRTFLLIGDSGERDPEIYAKIAKRFPRQVREVWIRDIAGNPMSDMRQEQLARWMRGIPLRVFRDPSELLPGL
jgi:phosphatidate phosphatase APP1